MFAGFYTAASALHASEVQQEAVAQNLAHLNVPGYRQVINTFATPDAFTQETGGAPVGGSRPMVGAKHNLVVDFTPGMLQTTEWPLDAALDGDGFFTVNTPKGVAYTRDGTMHIDTDGRLVNAAGYPYAGVSSVPPNLAPGDITISSDGTIKAGDQNLGKLEVVQFANNQMLRPAGPTLFFAGEARALPATNVVVQQGARELANVHATDELIKMLIGSRHHESAQRALTAMSETLQQHISGDQ